MYSTMITSPLLPTITPSILVSSATAALRATTTVKKKTADKTLLAPDLFITLVHLRSKLVALTGSLPSWSRAGTLGELRVFANLSAVAARTLDVHRSSGSRIMVHSVVTE